MTFKKVYERIVIFFEKATMFPIIFYSVGTLAFYNQYGMSPYADEKILKVCVGFCCIYFGYFLSLETSMFLNKRKDNYTKWQYMSSMCCDIFNSIIIIKCIGS